MGHFKRRHTTENSFGEENKAFLDHPFSQSPSKPMWDSTKDKVLLAAGEDLKSAILKQLSKENPNLSRASSEISSKNKTDDVLFLTQDELEAAQENQARKYKDILKSEYPLLTPRAAIDPQTSKDPGLEWLFESDVTFVDCSASVTNQVICRSLQLLLLQYLEIACCFL